MVTVKDALRAVRARWWLPVIGILVGLAVAGAVLWQTTPLYASSTQLFIGAAGSPDSGATGSTATADAYAAGLFSQQRVESYVELLESERLAQEVVDDLGLDLSPAEVASRVHAAVVPETVVLDVTVLDPSPQRARDIAEAVGRRFAQEASALETPRGAVDSAVQVTTVESATLEADPVSPDVPRDLALGAGLGLLAGLLLALLPARLDRSVRTPADVRDATGRGVLATLVEDPQLSGGLPRTALDAGSVNAPAVRAVRAHLRLGYGATPPRVVVVTSAVPGEGASSLALSLSLSLAQSGTRVVLVDADPHGPGVTRDLGLSGRPGLTDVLAGAATLGQALQPREDGALTVLPAGSASVDPGTPGVAVGLRTVLGTLRTGVDVVVVDAPSLSPVPDATVLAPVADGFLLVTRFGHTSREQLTAAAATLADDGAELLGVVLNRVPGKAAHSLGLRLPYPADRHRAQAETASADLRPAARGGSRVTTPVKTATPVVKPELS